MLIKTSLILIVVLVVLIVVAGVVGYFAGSSVAPKVLTVILSQTPPVVTTTIFKTETITSTVLSPIMITQTVSTTIPPLTITTTITKTEKVTTTETVTVTVTYTVVSPPLILPYWPKEILMKAGPIGSPILAVGVTLGDLINKYLGIIVHTEPGNSADNILAISKNEADIGFCHSFQSVIAKDPIKSINYWGEVVNFSNVKLVASGLWKVYIHAVRRADFQVGNFKELVNMIKQGMPVRIGVGIRGTLDEYVLRILLAKYGLSYDDVRKAGGTVFTGSSRDIMSLMSEGKIDVWLSSGELGFTDMLEADKIIKLAPLYVSEDDIDYIVWNLGLMRGVIPEKTYNWVPRGGYITVYDVWDIIVRATLPEDLVYQITRLLDENKDYIASVTSLFKEFDPAKGWAYGGFWELHPSAMKYYKDKGYVPN
jgi:TRAP transporter TAXI family solute receptor